MVITYDLYHNFIIIKSAFSDLGFILIVASSYLTDILTIILYIYLIIKAASMVVQRKQFSIFGIVVIGLPIFIFIASNARNFILHRESGIEVNYFEYFFDFWVICLLIGRIVEIVLWIFMVSLTSNGQPPSPSLYL